jgi:hypothetical protein
MDTDAQGNRIVLREGNNDFICQPGKPQFVAQPASCYTINSKPRIASLTCERAQRSISDPDDKTSSPLAVGRQEMIVMPSAPKPRNYQLPVVVRGRLSCGQELALRVRGKAIREIEDYRGGRDTRSRRVLP